MPALFPTLAVALLVISLWSGSHYWRTLSISWLATLSVGFYLVLGYEDKLSIERLWGYFLFVTLLLWSVLLTPVQLIFSKPQERKPTSSVRLLSDPISAGVKRRDVKADIFAIHGLGSDSNLAWTHLQSGKSWLQDFLPGDFPTLRIVAINHDSRWDAHSPVQSLRDYGQVILDSIANLRREDDERKRPLILIGHSFGGILLKKALVIGKEADAETRQRSVSDNAHAALFFGTPHRGSNFALFGTLASYFSYWRGSRTDLLEFLTPSSIELEDLHLSFLRAFNNIFVCNFFETIPVRLFDIPLYLVVSKQSAAIDGRKAVPVEADHRGLNKFASREDENYVRVCIEIENTLSYIQEQQEIAREKNQYSVPFRIRGVPVIGVFVGRESILESMEQYLLHTDAHQRLRVLTLQGLGGIGKSQIAIEYATRHQIQYTAIFWVSGKSHQVLKLDMARLAEKIPLKSVLDATDRIPREEAAIEIALNAVLDWLSEPGNSRWLLIIDNVDQQMSGLAGEKSVDHSYDIRDFFPATHQGSILITTRLTYLRQLGKGIDVDTVTSSEGLQILHNSSGRHDSEEDSRAVVLQMQGLPLALNQAGSYMFETGTSPRKYLELYKHRARRLLERKPQFAIYENGSVMTTWEISLEAANGRNPISGRLLQLWAFLDNSDMSYDILQLALNCSNTTAAKNSPLPSPNGEHAEFEFVHRSNNEEERDDWLTKLAEDEFLFSSAIATLQEFSLIQQKEDSDIFTIHPVVHEWARQRLNSVQWTENLIAAVSIVGRAIPLGHFHEAWILQRRLRPHAEHLETLLRATDEDLSAASSGFHGMAIMYFDSGHYTLAGPYYERAARGFEQLLGSEDFLTVRAYHDLGLVYRNLEDYERCYKLWTWTLETSERTQGFLHETTLRALDDLGRLCVLQDKYSEACELFLKALKGKEKLFGKDDIITVDTVRQLGIAERKSGRLEEAQPLHERVLQVFDQKLGSEHNWTLLAVADLGALFQDQGKLAEAEVFFSRALEGLEKVLGQDHNHTLETKVSMGKLYMVLGRYENAEKLFAEAEDGFKISLGANNRQSAEARRLMNELKRRNKR